MIIVRIEHAVPAFEMWKEAFDRDPADRKGSGVLAYRILRANDDPNYLMIDLEFADYDTAESFVQKMQQIWSGPGKAVMHGPQYRIAELVEAKRLS
jgi:hypothetical protein